MSVKTKLLNLKMKFFDYVDPEKFWTKRGEVYKVFDDEVKGKLEKKQEPNFAPLKKVKWSSLMEFGCGYGRNLEYLERKFKNRILVGVDFSKTQMANSIARAPMFYGDISDLPFVFLQYDVCMSSGVLMHVPFKKIVKVRNEMMRISRKYILLIEEVHSQKMGKTDENNYVFYHDYKKLFSGCKVVSEKKIKSIFGNQDEVIILFEKKN